MSRPLVRLAMLTVIFSLILTGGKAIGDIESASNGEINQDVKQVTLKSEILNENRRIRIKLPQNYKKGGQKYPVVYLLDSNSDRFHNRTAACDWEGKPELIMVGIENVNRSRDMFPVNVGGRHPQSGGGAKFLAFITDELVPYIDRSYETNDFRILIGYSNSGLFTIYAMLEAPQHFRGFISASPMIGYCHEYVFGRTREFFAKSRAADTVLYFNQGDDDYPHAMNYGPKYAELLKELAPKDFRWKHEIIKGGDHVPPATECNGLKFVFGVDK